MRLRIGAKLAVGFLCMIVVAGVGGWWSYRTLVDLQSRYGGLLNHTYPTALAAMNLNAEVQTQAQLIMQYAATRDERAIQKIKGSRERAEAHFKQLQSSADVDTSLDSLIKAVSDHRARFNRMVNELFVSGDELASDQLLLSAESARSVGEAMGKSVQQLVTELQTRVDQEQQSVEAAAAMSVQVLMIVGAIALGLGVLIILLAQVMIARPVRRVTEELQLIASGAGDLTRRIHIRTGDELQMLAESFNHMQESLQVMVKEVVQASEVIVSRTRDVGVQTQSVAAAAEQVKQAMESVAAGASSQVTSVDTATQTMDELLGAISQIASGASQQAMQVQETTQTVSTMVISMRGVAEHASQVSEAASVAADTALKGANIVDQTLEGMQRIRDQVLNAARRMEELDSHSRRIGEIMVVITDIADQTNLLALNAAIEAARAGEQGRGFAVVAEEVRKLAERAAHSAKEIRYLIKNIQSGTNEAVTAIKAGANDVESGAALAASAGTALKEILTTVERTTKGIHSISTAASEVLAATNEVARSVEEVAAVSEENSAATEEMAAGANQVSTTITEVQKVSVGNSTSVEQVSSSMTEVNQSMLSIARTAGDLSRIAEQMQKLMTRFKVE